METEDVQLKKLERAEAEADATWKAIYQPDETATGSSETDETAEATADGAQQKEGGDTAGAEDGGDATAASADTATATSAETTEKPPEPEDKTDWKQKYQTIEGKYKAELPRLRQELQQWQDYATNLQNRVTALEEAAKSRPAAKQAADTGDDVAADEAELESLAMDYPGAAKLLRKIRDGYRAEVASLRDRLETGLSSEIQTVKGELQQSKIERFNASMDSLVGPDWRDLDKDPAFLQWLSEVAPYTDATKLQLLRAAAGQFNAGTAAQFFNDYRRQQAGGNGDGGDGSAASETSGGESAQAATPPPKLAKSIAPPRSTGSVAPGTTAASTSYTMADYQRFYAESARGKYDPKKWGGRTEEQTEAMFDALIARKALR